MFVIPTIAITLHLQYIELRHILVLLDKRWPTPLTKIFKNIVTWGLEFKIL
jgi:hypothetical protein